MHPFSAHRKVFWYFQWVENRCIRNKWLIYHSILFSKPLNPSSWNLWPSPIYSGQFLYMIAYASKHPSEKSSPFLLCFCFIILHSQLFSTFFGTFHRYTQNPFKHPKSSFLRIVYGFRPLNMLSKSSISDVWLSSEYTSKAFCSFELWDSQFFPFINVYFYRKHLKAAASNIFCKRFGILESRNRVTKVSYAKWRHTSIY